MKNSNWVNRARKWMSWFGVLRVKLEKDLRRFDIFILALQERREFFEVWTQDLVDWCGDWGND